MHPAVTPVAATFRLNTELLLNCLSGVNDQLATQRLTPSSNSIAFLVAHLVDSRHFIAKLLGAPAANPLPPSVRQASTLEEAGSLPPLNELVAHWESIAAHLAVQVERLDTVELHQMTQRFPGSDGTLAGALAFLAQHESYHLGQIALLRRQLGLPAMSYLLTPREQGRKGA